MRIKSTVSVLLLIAAAPFHANADSAPSASASQEAFNTQALFETSISPLQVCELSAHEMKETEGAWSPASTMEGFRNGYRPVVDYRASPVENFGSNTTRLSPGAHFSEVFTDTFVRGIVNDFRANIDHTFGFTDANKLILGFTTDYSYILADGIINRTSR